MTPKLKVLHGKNAGHEIRLKGSKFIIGRGEECQLRPKSDAISRQHCEFEIDGSQVAVKDLGSKNGTLVNGTRIEGSQSLNEGDEIQIGKLAFAIVGLVAVEPGEPAAKKEKPAAMFTDQSIEDSDISAWLQEGDDSNRARELAEPETKQFRLEEADRDALHAAADADTADADTADADTADADDNSSSEADSSKKKTFGKLPTKMPVSSTDSREAASDMLKKFFGRR